MKLHRLPQRLGRRLRHELFVIFRGLPEIELDRLFAPAPTLPAILDDICMPPYYGPAHDDLGALLRMIVVLQPRVVIELGTAHGNTVANICRQAPQARVVTVNALAEQQTGNEITYVLGREEIGRVYRDHGFADRVQQILANTQTVALSQYLQTSQADLAIIDACHDQHYVMNDFFKVVSFMGPQGIVLFHDTHPSMRNHLRGSYLACVALRRQGYDVRHIRGTWWAIWFRNGVPQRPLVVRPRLSVEAAVV